MFEVVATVGEKYKGFVKLLIQRRKIRFSSFEWEQIKFLDTTFLFHQYGFWSTICIPSRFDDFVYLFSMRRLWFGDEICTNLMIAMLVLAIGIVGNTMILRLSW